MRPDLGTNYMYLQRLSEDDKVAVNMERVHLVCCFENSVHPDQLASVKPAD